jgi:hypothetical protein
MSSKIGYLKLHSWKRKGKKNWRGIEKAYKSHETVFKEKIYRLLELQKD